MELGAGRAVVLTAVVLTTTVSTPGTQSQRGAHSRVDVGSDRKAVGKRCSIKRFPALRRGGAPIR
jgi:hypothetical protein